MEYERVASGSPALVLGKSLHLLDANAYWLDVTGGKPIHIIVTFRDLLDSSQFRPNRLFFPYNRLHMLPPKSNLSSSLDSHHWGFIIIIQIIQFYLRHHHWCIIYTMDFLQFCTPAGPAGLNRAMLWRPSAATWRGCASAGPCPRDEPAARLWLWRWRSPRKMVPC